MSFNKNRYEQMNYRRCGRSGLKLPEISLGMWHNFGGEADHDNCRAMMRLAFDEGVTHFDLANGYGPPMGSAEQRVGRILKQDFADHRDELIISSKAGWPYWEGPYGILLWQDFTYALADRFGISWDEFVGSGADDGFVQKWAARIGWLFLACGVLTLTVRKNSWIQMATLIGGSCLLTILSFAKYLRPKAYIHSPSCVIFFVPSFC